MIRKLRVDELEKIMPWMVETAEASFGKVIPKILDKKIKEDYYNFPEGFVVYELDGKLIGLLWFEFSEEKKSVFIHAIYVLAEFRGKKISDELMNYLEKYCKDNNINSIDLNVTTSLDYAIKFYERSGFKITRYSMSKKL